MFSASGLPNKFRVSFRFKEHQHDNSQFATSLIQEIFAAFDSRVPLEIDIGSQQHSYVQFTFNYDVTKFLMNVKQKSYLMFDETLQNENETKDQENSAIIKEDLVHAKYPTKAEIEQKIKDIDFKITQMAAEKEKLRKIESLRKSTLIFASDAIVPFKDLTVLPSELADKIFQLIINEVPSGVK